MTALATQIRAFADLPAPADGNDEALTSWILGVRAADLPFLRSFTNGLERDRAAVDAALTPPHHNGRTEGVNNKTKLLKRPTYERAGHALPRQLIRLNCLPDSGDQRLRKSWKTQEEDTPAQSSCRRMQPKVIGI